MASVVADRPASRIHPLRNGDNLSREEFERLWEEHPEIKRAELIGGIVYIDMSVGPAHATSHTIVMTWLGVYWRGRSEIQVCDNVTVRMADGDDVQPDALVRYTGANGMSRRTDSAIEGPPEFVFEVAASSAAYDLHQKSDVYARNGVPEYVVWQLYENRLDWFELRDGAYARREVGADGTIESAQFPGLRLHVERMLRGDVAGVLAALGPA